MPVLLSWACGNMTAPEHLPPTIVYVCLAFLMVIGIVCACSGMWLEAELMRAIGCYAMVVHAI